jgi:uncharacterized protein YbaP (TraB family)
MKHFRHCLLLVVLVLSFVLPICAKDAPAAAATTKHSAWLVKGEKCSVYLLGSVHVLKSEHYPLPAVFESAFSNASIVVFETDLDEMMKLDTQRSLLTKAQLPDGQTLKDVLTEKTYADLLAWLKENQVPEMMFASMRPGMVAMTLLALDLQKAGYNQEDGMDLYFEKRCKKYGKTVRGFETVDFQIGLLCDLTKEEGEGVIKSTLKDLKDGQGKFDELIKAWQTGDTAALEKLMNDAQKDDPAVMKRLVTDRNLKWVPQLQELVKGTNNAVVIVGAGHLVGKDGVVELLKQRGCKVTQE